MGYPHMAGDCPADREKDGHEVARSLIVKHGTDRYPTVESQFMKLTEEIGELSGAILKDRDPEHIAKEYADVGLSLFRLGDHLGLDLNKQMRDVAEKETRTFDHAYKEREAGDD